jgi:NADH dehydrogenase [ubiquinone] 1 alpha subcomplex assembly factor 7
MVELDRREAKDEQIVTPLIQEIYRPDLHLPSAPSDWKGYEPRTPLSDAIIARIGVSGRPLSTAEYMRTALLDPEHGYYTQAKTTKHLFHLRSGQGRDEFEDNDWDDEPDASSAGPSTTAAPSESSATIIGADFVTAPEVSHVFGECVGVWFATQWQSELYKNGWQWLECGPGKGTLMVDLLRFTLQLSSEIQKKQPHFRASGEIPPSFFGDGCEYVHLIERSPIFRQQQREALEKAFRHDFRFDFGDEKASLIIDGSASLHKMKRALRVRWHDTFADFMDWSSNTIISKDAAVPDDEQRRLPTFIVGQEFLDALPVYTFEKTTEGYWRERLVDVVLRDDLQEEEKEMVGTPAPSNEPSFTTTNGIALAKRPRLRVVLAPDVTPPLKTLLHTDDQGYISSSGNNTDTSPPGSVVEVCPEAILLAQDVAKVVQEQGGAALFIDYGSAQGSSDSLRGYSRHEQVPFLSLPGQVDITADVDFSALKHAIHHRPPAETVGATTVQAFGPVTQGSFLMAMGIQERVINLVERDDTTEEQAENLYRSLLRLASPEEMGERYKVLAIVPVTTTTTSTSDATAVNAPAGF